MNQHIIHEALTPTHPPTHTHPQTPTHPHPHPHPHTLLGVKTVTLYWLSSLPHPSFEGVSLLQSHCVRLGNDWDNVDTIVQPLHELNVKGLHTGDEGRGGVRENKRGGEQGEQGGG